MKKYFFLLVSVLCLSTLSNHCFAQFSNLYGAYDTLTYVGDPGNTTITIYIGNNDADSSGGGLLELYVSLDTLLNTQEDSSLFIFYEPAVGAGDTSIFTITIDFCSGLILNMLPNYALGGAQFYILYKLDVGENNVESNENDNVGVIMPNLYIGCTLGISAPLTNCLSVYPNPSDGIFNITFPSLMDNDLMVGIQDINTQSEISLSDFKNASEKTFDLSFLPPGIYLLKVQSHDQYFQKKIIIER